MRIAQHISELIGGTPLVRLNSVIPAGAGTVVAKVEYLNPGGSSKDRIAAKMIDAAEASGQLKPGGTIVEPTSGNTGVGLALVAQHRGYKCVFVCPDKVSEDKRNVLLRLRRRGGRVPDGGAARGPGQLLQRFRPAGRGDRRRLEARPVRQPAGTGQPLRDHRPGDLGRHRRQGHPLRRRHRHRRDDHRRGPLPQGGVGTGGCASSAPTPRARCIRAAPAGPIWSRASARTSGRRPTTRRCPTRSSRCPTPTRST